MKFEVLSSDLLSHLTTISHVLISKNSMPILDNFLFQVQPGILTMTASDGDTTIVTSTTIENVTGEGSFAVPVKTLIDPIKEMPQQTLLFEVDDDNLEIFVHYQNGKYNFIAENAKEYPLPKPLSEGASHLELSAQTLLSGIQSTIFATADDDLRPVMNGIYFDIKPEHIVFVASDSKKLVRLINNSVKPGFESCFILPKKPATLIKNSISKDMEDAIIDWDEKCARITVGGYQITCRLIEGRFPRYEAVIPKNNINHMIIDRQVFVNAVRRISVFANSATNQIKFELDKNLLTISSQDMDYSHSGIETVTCTYDGAPMKIGFRAGYLIEILNTVNADEVELRLSDPARAGLIVPVQNKENEDLLMLIMPMMLNEF